ncbi:MAG: hypothetical protein KME45_27420 [Stenomitos rutilans HA7619-LM2]|jgi:hypothetical protein|nr:hypothetical protein [Stenomitos rutilans HA7619-LM2]
MSDRTTQTLTNLTYEVTAIAAELYKFYQRLHQVAPNLVSASEVHDAEQRLNRLRTMFKGLQQRAKQD